MLSATRLAITFQCPGGVSELGPSAQNSARTLSKVPTRDKIGSIGRTGNGVDGPASAVIGAQRVVPKSSGRYIKVHSVVRSEFAAPGKDIVTSLRNLAPFGAVYLRR